MSERRAKLYSIICLVVILGPFLFAGKAYLSTRAQVLAERDAERRERLEAYERLRQQVVEAEEARELQRPERLVPPASISFPFY